MNASYKTAIKYKDLLISVKMLKISRDNSIELNQLCKESKERVRYKKYCPSCNKEITNEDIIKGYQYAENKFITLSSSELENLKSEEDKFLNIKYFCKSKEVDELLIDKSYYLLPEINSEIKYALFYKALSTNRVAAIAEITLGTKQELVMLVPKDNYIVASILFYKNEINEIPNMHNHKVAKSDYVQLKDMIVKDVKKFDWSKHCDDFQLRLRELILNKIPK